MLSYCLASGLQNAEKQRQSRPPLTLAPPHADLYLTPVWRDIYLAEAVTRLQQYVQGVNLTTDLVYGMQSLCAYETQAIGVSDL